MNHHPWQKSPNHGISLLSAADNPIGVFGVEAMVDIVMMLLLVFMIATAQSASSNGMRISNDRHSLQGPRVPEPQIDRQLQIRLLKGQNPADAVFAVSDLTTHTVAETTTTIYGTDRLVDFVFQWRKEAASDENEAGRILGETVFFPPETEFAVTFAILSRLQEALGPRLRQGIWKP